MEDGFDGKYYLLRKRLPTVVTNEKQSDEKESAADIGSVVDVFAIFYIDLDGTTKGKRRRCAAVQVEAQFFFNFCVARIRRMTQVSITCSASSTKERGIA